MNFTQSPSASHRRRRFIQDSVAVLLGGFASSRLIAQGSSAMESPTAKEVIAQPGQVLKIPVGVITDNSPHSPEVRFGGKRAVVVREAGFWMSYIAIPLSAPLGPSSVLVRSINSAAHALDSQVEINVVARDYPEQRLTITNTRQVNPLPEDLLRIKRESAIVKKLYEMYDQRELFLPFLSPFPAQDNIPLSSRFGLRRYFNDEPRAPHSGLDFAAKANTPILCIGEGEVINTGDYFFNGQSVFVHHGQGILSFYCHLNKIHVKEGERVSAKSILGAVGATGRATGPHLHLGIYFSGTSTDPEPLLVARA